MTSMARSVELPEYLASLGVRCVRPRAGLGPYIQCLWASGHSEALPRTDATGGPAPQKFYPDGGASLLIYLSDASPRAVLSFQRQTQSRSLPGTTPLLSARLRPGVLHALFGLSPAECSGDGIPLSAVLEGDARNQFSSVLDRLVGLDAEGRLTQLEQWFSGYLGQVTPYRRRLQQLPALLGAGTQPLTGVAAELGMSTRTLERHCLREIGMPPSLLQACVRMRDARQLLATCGQSIAEVALACGYYDQAHFSRAFSDFVGETPGAYRKRKLSHSYKA